MEFRLSLLLTLLIGLPISALAEEKLLLVYDYVMHGSRSPLSQDIINATKVNYP